MDAKVKLKKWWTENKKRVKIGVACGMVGFGYGFINGVLSTEKKWRDDLVVNYSLNVTGFADKSDSNIEDKLL